MIIESNVLDFIFLKDGEQGEPGKQGENGKTLYTWIKYSQNANGSNMTDDPDGAIYVGFAYNKESATESTDPSDYSWTKIKGEDGKQGEDAYTIILSNENISFATNQSNIPLSSQSINCEVTVMKGSSIVTDFTIGTIVSVSGIDVSVLGKTITLSVASSTAIENDSGSIIIPITVDGYIFNKIISYSISKAGVDGKDGKTLYTWIRYADSPTSGMSASPDGKKYMGVAYNKTTSEPSNSYSDYKWSLIEGDGIVSVETERVKSTDKTTAPTSGWSIDNVTWESGTYIWTRLKIIYKSGNIEYTEPQVSSEWEAANQVQDNLEKEIEKVNSTISGVSSKVDQNTKSITDKVWQTDITNSINNYDNTTAEAIRERVTKTETDIGGIKSSVSDIQTDVKKKADGDTVKTLSEKVSTMEQDAESFKTTVSATYATKSSMETANGNISSLTTRVESAESKLTKDGLTTIVGDYYTTSSVVDEKIDGIVVGGRNLAQGTSSSFTNAFTNFTGGTNICPSLAKVLTDGLSVGDTITVKLIYKYTDVVATSGKTALCWIQGTGNVTGWSVGDFGRSPQKTLSGSGEHEFLYSFKITADHLKNSFWSTNIRHDYVQSGSVQWKMFKVEKGNKATDWTPAPEDVNSSISAVQTIATQTADKFNWLVKSGTSSTNFTLTDRTATLIAETISLNGNVKVNGDMLVDGCVGAKQIAATAVTADKLSVSTLSAICADLGSITAGAINIGNGKFVVDSSGNLTSQYIVATGGKIGCWNITDTEVNNGQWGNGFGTGFGYRSGTDFSGTDMAFWAGDGNFKVLYNGQVNISDSKSSQTIGLQITDLINGYSTNLTSYMLDVRTTGSYTTIEPGRIDCEETGKFFVDMSQNWISIETDNFHITTLNGVEITGDLTANGVVYSSNHSSGWIAVLQGYAGINVMDAGSSNGFNGLARVKCTNGAWAMGALNGDSFNTFVLAYANETRLNSGENGYDASFWFYPNGKLNVSNTITISAGDMVVSDGWIYLKNGMKLRTYDANGTGANLIHWGTDNRIYIGEITTKATKIRICQTCSNIGVLNSSGSWVTITTGVSDIREKNSIEDLKKSKEIIMGLKPKRFKFNDPEDDRYHLGFIAQDVRKTLDATIGDCAILEYNNTDPDEIRPVDRNDEHTFTYSMRYNEIIPPHVALTQEHEREIETLKSENQSLRDELNELKDMVQKLIA